MINEVTNRIKELEQECYEDRSHGYGSPYFNREKFVKLIIKECCVAMKEEDSFYGQWMSSVICVHFGIVDKVDDENR